MGLTLSAKSKGIYMRIRYDIDRLCLLLAAALTLLLAGCATTPPLHVDLMPSPQVYGEGGITPFTDDNVITESPYMGMLYATDRAPSDPETAKKQKERFYTSDRGSLLRLGLAEINLGEGEYTWEEARQISLAKNRPDKYPLNVVDVDELGILDDSYHPFVEEELLALRSEEPAQRFAKLINGKLDLSRQKEIFIYVPGYKVVFENPILVAMELWHYLGYEGVFIAFSWPATPKQTAYFTDAETTIASAYFLQVFLEYLAQSTTAEHINIVGYSQGTRVVTRAIQNLALKNSGRTRQEVQKQMRIGNVILIGGDLSRETMASYIIDGFLNIPNHLTVYVSEKDKAMSMAEFLFGRQRIGGMFKPDELTPSVVRFLEHTPEVSVVNVTDAEGATTENGHRYFRKSPWASSDLLMILRYNLSPAERGLVQSDGLPIWSFPPDYITQLRGAIMKANPSLGGIIKEQDTTDDQ
jgi:esterase/lipase superfamily enzyme